jgi:hypothetical protein
MTPALKFSTRMSASSIRRSSTSRASGFFRSSTIDRLLRLADWNTPP